MTIALTTRGFVCPTGYSALSILSWGQLCLVSTTVAVIGFSIPESLPDCSYVYTKNKPHNLANLNVNTLQVKLPEVQDPSPVIFSKAHPSLPTTQAVRLRVPTAQELTGVKLITLMGSKGLLLSEPTAPVLTSSGTSLPLIFEKDC